MTSANEGPCQELECNVFVGDRRALGNQMKTVTKTLSAIVVDVFDRRHWHYIATFPIVLLFSVIVCEGVYHHISSVIIIIYVPGNLGLLPLFQRSI